MREETWLPICNWDPITGEVTKDIKMENFRIEIGSYVTKFSLQLRSKLRIFESHFEPVIDILTTEIPKLVSWMSPISWELSTCFCR